MVILHPSQRGGINLTATQSQATVTEIFSHICRTTENIWNDSKGEAVNLHVNHPR